MKALTIAAQNIFPDIRTIFRVPDRSGDRYPGKTGSPHLFAELPRACRPPGGHQCLLAATQRYGAGTVGSGIISGYPAAHRQVEEDLAQFMNEEAAIFFNAVSAGVITAIVNRPLLPILEGVSTDELGSLRGVRHLQHDAHRNRESTPRRIMHHMRCGKLIPLPASSQSAPARRENILHPLGLAAVGERDDEPARRSKDVYGCTVDLA